MVKEGESLVGKETGIEASGTEFRCLVLTENKKTPQQGMGWGGSLPINSVLTLRSEAESGGCPGRSSHQSSRTRERQVQ